MMKDDNFVMGEVLKEYLHLTKIIYGQEMLAILNEEEKKTEKVQGSPPT